jgi:dihydrodipicolinate synthase/N-acetylneuraminate lyase
VNRLSELTLNLFQKSSRILKSLRLRLFLIERVSMSNFIEIKGVVPVLSTPLDENRKLDKATLKREIGWVGQQGVQTVATGMVSEILRMNLDERRELTESVSLFTQEFKMNSIVSCGQETAEATISLVIHAQDSGATAVMVNPPIASKLTDDEIYSYFSQVFEKTSIPIVVQDASGYVGYSINVSVLSRLYDSYSDRIYFKPEAVPIGQRLSELRDATGGKARIFEGTGGAHLVDSFTRGVIGTMPGADLSWAMVKLWDSLVAGDWQRVNLINGAIANMVNLMPVLDAYIAIEKHLLHKQGIFINTNKVEPVSFTFDLETKTEAERIFAYLEEIAR